MIILYELVHCTSLHVYVCVEDTYKSDEFSRNCTAFEKRDGLTPEEIEQKAIAKRKMLGNIKFIGKFWAYLCTSFKNVH